MLQITFLFIGVFILILVLATIFKRWQRSILWAASICIFLGTIFTIGFGLIDVVDGNRPNMPVIIGVVLALMEAAALAIGAEKLHTKQRELLNVMTKDNAVTTPVSEEQTASNDEAVVLTGMLNTELAIKVFAKAIEAGYMNEKGSHYKWNDSKVLLAYMCGRIYCGDKPVYSDMDEKSFWKFGRLGVFPDTELSNLFEMPDLGQSRSNRKDLAVPAKSKEIDKFFE